MIIFFIKFLQFNLFLHLLHCILIIVYYFWFFFYLSLNGFVNNYQNKTLLILHYFRLFSYLHPFYSILNLLIFIYLNFLKFKINFHHDNYYYFTLWPSRLLFLFISDDLFLFFYFMLNFSNSMAQLFDFCQILLTDILPLINLYLNLLHPVN